MFKSLTSEFFCQQKIENFKNDSKAPHERLSDIFDLPRKSQNTVNSSATAKKRLQRTASRLY
jgi:hypothetical protein